MGIRPVPAPVESNKVDPDLIKDICNQISMGKQILIIHDGSKASKKKSKGLLKLIPQEDVFKVRIMKDEDFEKQREPDPNLKKYYRISKEAISSYYISNPH